MKKYLLALLAVSCFAGAAAAEKMFEPGSEPGVAVVHFGPKPAGLDEARWPDIKFYYVPGVAVEQVPKTVPPDYKMTGAPETLVKWYNTGAEENCRVTNRAFLFDKNGVAAFDGLLGRQEDLTQEMSRKTKDPLKDALKNLVKKGKEAKADDREFKADDKKGLVGLKMPEFEVVDAAGKAVSVNSFIVGAPKPMLVLFAHFPADTKFDMTADNAASAAKAETDKAKSAGAFFGGMAKMALASKKDSMVGSAKEAKDDLTGRDAAVTYPKLLDKVELQLLGKDVTKKEPAK